jgi:putative ABC transport system substrate-binding protein
MDGKNITVEYRFAEQDNKRLPSLAEALLRLKVDLIVVSGTGAALAAKSATTTVPIVMANIEDPVRSGLVDSPSTPPPIARSGDRQTQESRKRHEAWRKVRRPRDVRGAMAPT